MTNADLRGRATLLSFVSAHCTDSCPLYLATLRAGANAFRDAGGETPRVAIVTVDPDADTVGYLKTYAAAWPPEWLFLTGTYTQLAPVWEAYGVTVEKRPPRGWSELGQGYSVAHNAKVVVVDESGRAARELSGSWTAQRLTSVLEETRRGEEASLGIRVSNTLDNLLRRCGDFAATYPAVFASIVLAIMLPGFVLSGYLLQTFLRNRLDDRGSSQPPPNDGSPQARGACPAR
ncbi:MAG: SCO family protein [Chloroflexi bacterium]|nr:SCO family protein [Chloroflexota bacterium]